MVVLVSSRKTKKRVDRTTKKCRFPSASVRTERWNWARLWIMYSPHLSWKVSSLIAVRSDRGTRRKGVSSFIGLTDSLSRGLTSRRRSWSTFITVSIPSISTRPRGNHCSLNENCIYAAFNLSLHRRSYLFAPRANRNRR